MTGEAGPPTPAAPGRLTFLREVEPLPLADPKNAARFLRIERHTLACYRSLAKGPPYDKFGRSVRYAWTDLREWRDGIQPGDHPICEDDPDETGLVIPEVAARFLTVTRTCLANYRRASAGPKHYRLGRRVYYSIQDLRRWASEERRSSGPHFSNGAERLPWEQHARSQR